METERIFPGVWEFRTTYGRDAAELFTDGPMPHAAWLVEGDRPAILDPGPTSIAEELLDAIRKAGQDTDAIEWVVPSHIHVDHAGGSGWLVRELPRAKAVFHARGAPFMRDPARLIAGTAEVFGDDWRDVFGDILPVPDERVAVVEDGDEMDFGAGGAYRVVFTPGHSLDHIALHDEERGALYCGHALGNYKPPRFLPDPPMTLPYFDVDASVASIRKARELAPKYLLPVHSGFLASNAALAIDAVERVTIEVGEIVKDGMAAGKSEAEMEEDVRTHLFADPTKADRSYRPVVVSYLRYYERQARKAANAGAAERTQGGG